MVTVLHVSQPTEAGVANVVLSLVQDQIARGWSVHLACPTDGYLAHDAAALGAVLHSWSATRSPGPSSVLETRALQKIITRVQPDLVHLHSAKAGLTGRLAVHGRRPTVFQPHAWSYEAVSGPVALASQLWERLATRWTSLTVCVSEAEKALGQRRRTLPGRTVVVPNGVDTHRWHPVERAAARTALGLAEDDPTVVCVGRLCRQKGQDVLLACWPAVVTAFPQARLFLVGDGPDHDDLAAALPPRTTLVGRGDPAPWFGTADVVVVPSRWEGMPLVVLEAMAAGRVVVATDVNGVREALDLPDLVAPDDPVALAAALRGTLAQDHVRRAAAETRNRRRAVETLDISLTTNATVRAYEAVIG